MRRALTLVLATLAAAGCSLDITMPRSDLEGLPEELAVELTLAPDVVSAGDAFTARLRVTNTGSSPVQLTTAGGCLAHPRVIRNGELIPFRGTAVACTAAITTHRFEPGQVRTLEWQLRAELEPQQPGSADGVPAPPGTYSVQARFDLYWDPAAGPTPTLERTLRVR